MFDVILYPVSAVLWFWHAVFGTAFGPDAGVTWVLSVVFLVFSLRALLIRPAISQLRSARAMRAVAPQVRRLRERHGGDRQRMAEELRKLGVNPLGGCLPILVQIPVFLGLYHVLQGFRPGVERNLVFDDAGVRSFLNADLFGATLGNWISQPTSELLLFGTDRAHLLAVGLPLLVVAGVATYVSLRMSTRDAEPGQAAMVGRLMTYLAPVGLLFSGLVLPMPIAVLLYFLANNIWTLCQQFVITRTLGT